MSALTREERIELIRQVQELRERVEAVMLVLVPEEAESGECPHPPHMVEDESTMGAPEFHCTRCGRTQDRPFTEVL